MTNSNSVFPPQALVKAQKADIASPAGEDEKATAHQFIPSAPWSETECGICGKHIDKHKPSPSPAPGETGELVDLLTQIANHDWRISMLAHTSDTAKRAAALITSQSQEIERMREGLRPFAEEADRYRADLFDDTLIRRMAHETDCTITVGDLRRARELAGKEVG